MEELIEAYKYLYSRLLSETGIKHTDSVQLNVLFFGSWSQAR